MKKHAEGGRLMREYPRRTTMTVAASSKMDSNTMTTRLAFCLTVSFFFLTVVISGRIRRTEDDGSGRRILIQTTTVSETTMIEEGNDSQQWDTTCAANNSIIDSETDNFLNTSTAASTASSSSPSPSISPLSLDLNLLYNIYLTNDSPLTMNYTATKSLMESIGRGLHEAIVSIAMPCENIDSDSDIDIDGGTTSTTSSYFYTMTSLSTRPDEYEILDFGCDSDISTAFSRNNASATSQALTTVSNDVVVACHQVSTVINFTLLYAGDTGTGARNDGSGGRARRQESLEQNLRSNGRRLVTNSSSSSSTGSGRTTATTTTVPYDALVELTEWLETAFEVVSSTVVGASRNDDGESASNNGVSRVTFKGFLDLSVDNLGGGVELPDPTGQLISKQDSPDALNDSVLTQSNSNAGNGIDWGSYGLPIMLVGAVAMSVVVIAFIIQRRRNHKAFQDHINNLDDPDVDNGNEFYSVDDKINELDVTPQSMDDDDDIDAYGEQQQHQQDDNLEHRDTILHCRDTGVTTEDAIIPTQDLNRDYRGKHRRKEQQQQQQVEESDKYSGIENILMKLFCWESN